MKLLQLGFLLLFVGLVSSRITLPSYFGDGMVIQRNAVWCLTGATDHPNHRVKVKVDKASRTTATDSKGNFDLCFISHNADKRKFEIKLEVQNRGCIVDSLTLTNVVYGDVYLCSGQSNIEMAMELIFNATQEINSANFDDIRLFTVKKIANLTTEQKYLQHELANGWNPAIPSTLNSSSPLPLGVYTSALCYLTARDIYNGLGGQVAIGMMISSWTGLPIRSFMSPEAYTQCPPNPPQPPASYLPEKEPSAMWNAMLHPLIGMKLSGYVFWQGEGDLSNQTVYPCQFRTLIRDWRSKFGNEPFFYIQSAPFPSADGVTSSFAELRLTQESGLLEPDTYRTVVSDNGDPQTDIVNATQYILRGIHPRDKQKPARRTANKILKIKYRKNIDIKNPEFRDVSVKTTNGVTTLDIKLKNANGLYFMGTPFCAACCGNGKENAFAARINGVWTGLSNITIDGSSIKASFPGNQVITGVRYAYYNYPQCVLYRNGLPAVPFVKTF